jgi:hypothetical protein
MNFNSPNFPDLGPYYKTFYGRNLWMLVTSLSTIVSDPQMKHLFRFNQVYSMIIFQQIIWVFMWNEGR